MRSPFLPHTQGRQGACQQVGGVFLTGGVKVGRSLVIGGVKVGGSLEGSR